MIVGFIDQVTQRIITGWAANRDDPESLTVRLLVDGVEHARQRADRLRPGLIQRKVHPTGLCGFRFDLDNALTHNCTVEVVAGDDRVALRGSPWRYCVPDHQKLFFMHIAKTAGSSLNQFLLRQFPARRRITHCERIAPKDFVELFNQNDFVSGHVRMATVTGRVKLRDFGLITLLRDPIEHLASHLSWVRHIGEQPESRFFNNHPPAIRELATELRSVDLSSAQALEKFLNKPQALRHNLFNNCQARYFLPTEKYGALTLDDIKTAKQCLQKFHIVGTLERYDDFIAELCRQQGWSQPPVSEPINAQPNRFGLDISEPATAAIMRSQVELDQALYDFIRQDHAGLFTQTHRKTSDLRQPMPDQPAAGR